MKQDFYRAFEDRHRGSRDTIKVRQEVYLPFVQPVARALPSAPVLDLGCGRGEWLELLAGHGISAEGVDLDEGMLAACRERGFRVQAVDAVSHLRSLPDGSRSVVSGFHIAEHLPFAVLEALVAEALRVLAPGGLLILETPNPENVVVGTAGFFMDPTHERPLPPQLLAFLPEFAGFARTKTLRLQEPAVLHGSTSLSVLDVLGGSSPDYAVVARKQPPPGADAAAEAAIDAAFARDYGLSLNVLAARYEGQLQGRIAAVAETARTAEDIALAMRMAISNVDAQFAATEKLVQEMRQLSVALQLQVRQSNQELGRMGDTLAGVYASRSWRITKPLRIVTAQLAALREQGLRRRLLGRPARLVRTQLAALREHGFRARSKHIYTRLRGAVLRRAAHRLGLLGFGRLAARLTGTPGVQTALPARDRAVSPHAARALSGSEQKVVAQLARTQSEQALGEPTQQSDHAHRR